MWVYSRIMGNSLSLFRIRGLRFCAIAAVALLGFSIAACDLSGNGSGSRELAGSVSITGTPKVGETLGVNIRNLDGSGNVSFEWMADGQTFTNNRGATLHLGTIHATRTITVTVTTSGNSGGVTSLPIGPIIAAGETLPPLTGSVSITGIPRLWQTLRANTDYLGGSGEIFYQWMMGNETIGTGAALLLDGLHMGRAISVTVTRANNSGSVTSPSTSPVEIGIVPPLAGSVSIIGSPNVGNTLRVNANNLRGGGEIFYQWMVGNETVGTGGTLFLLPGDLGQLVTVTVMRENHSSYVTSLPAGPVTLRPVLTGTIGITGATHVGQTLRINTANLGGSGTMSFVWRAGDTTVGTGSTLPLTNAHLGQMITVTITRANNDGSVTSPAVGPVTIPPLTGTISITGAAHVGQTLGVNTAGLGGSGAMSFVWRAGGNTVSTSSNTLLLSSAHLGQTITVTVTRANHYGSVTSQPVGPVTPAPPPPPITITITGIPWHYVGHWGGIDLEANWGNWVAESAWQRITGSSATFTMRGFDGTPFNVAGTYRVHFSIDDDWGAIGDYSVTRTLSAGGNTIPFTAFIPVFSSFSDSEDLESAEEGMTPVRSRTRTRR